VAVSRKIVLSLALAGVLLFIGLNVLVFVLRMDDPNSPFIVPLTVDKHEHCAPQRRHEEELADLAQRHRGSSPQIDTIGQSPNYSDTR
jgi:hypothetical protein